MAASPEEKQYRAATRVRGRSNGTRNKTLRARTLNRVNTVHIKSRSVDDGDDDSSEFDKLLTDRMSLTYQSSFPCCLNNNNVIFLLLLILAIFLFRRSTRILSIYLV
jgi:hypothetical protein